MKNNKMPEIRIAACAALIVLQCLAFPAALAGTGCTAGGDCAVNASQTIDSGASYYFNSLVINQGVVVSVAYSAGTAGGTVKFYVANDANISGAISANGTTALTGLGSSNPDGGGYGGGADTSSGTAPGGGGGSGGVGGSGNGVSDGGSGGGFIQIYAKKINIPSTGLLSVNGGTGTSSGYATNGGGGGSGGTIRLIADRITFSGTLSGTGGNAPYGGASSGGGGAGGSLLFMPLSMSTFSAGAMNFNGGSSFNGGAGAGSGGPGGSSAGNGGIANPNRNIKIYNSIIPPGSTFAITSSGIAAGLLDLYNTPNNAAFSGLSITQITETAQVFTFDQNIVPVSGITIKAVNLSNSSSIYAQTTTDSSGIAHFSFTVPQEGFDVIAEPVIQGGRISAAVGKSADLTHAATSLTSLDQIAHLYIRRLDIDMFKPDGSKQQYFFSVNNTLGQTSCAGSTSTSGAVSCFLIRSDIDSGLTRINNTVLINTSAYSLSPSFSQVQVPGAITVGGNTSDTKLRGMTSTGLMKAGLPYTRTAFYTPSAASESNFVYTETIPADFAFGQSATATMAMTGGSTQNCTFAAPSVGKTITFNAANCPILANALTFGNWIRFDYGIIAPQPDAFFAQTQDYTFNQGAMLVNTASG